MRFRHETASQIRSYVEGRKLFVTRCSVTGHEHPAVSSADEIEDMEEKSEKLWGLALPYFLSVSMSPAEVPPMTLADAVGEVEADTKTNRFLIVAYQDGGLITISGRELPFQKDAKIAEWWKPW